ncbi:MAG: hypothetical protein AB7N70_04860 [Dehalococcoidia bacterium]
MAEQGPEVDIEAIARDAYAGAEGKATFPLVWDRLNIWEREYILSFTRSVLTARDEQWRAWLLQHGQITVGAVVGYEAEEGRDGNR